MKPRQILDYYSREDVQQFFAQFSKGREVVGVFSNGSFAARPNTLNYKEDIISLVKTGIVEFHASLEHWSNVMSLRPENYQELRTGWDLIIDLDCKVFEYGKFMAVHVCQALKKHGIRNFSVKFTGGTGFHIGIPWKAFPKQVDNRPMEKLFPRAAVNITGYLKEYMRDWAGREFMKKFSSFDQVAMNLGKPVDDLIDEKDRVDIFKIVGIDTVLLSPRHLFRMPYSLNCKTFLVSLPLALESLEGFERTMTRPERVKVSEGFLGAGEEGEASLLVGEAMDMASRIKPAEKNKPEVRLTERVTEEFFPPCMKNILNGLQDGKKRSIFILANFLKSINWKWEEIETFIEAWNQKNNPPLPDTYLRGQLRWHKGKPSRLPPNCKNEGYYPSFGVCVPDQICGWERKTIKNPVKYVVVTYGKKMKRNSRPKK